MAPTGGNFGSDFLNGPVPRPTGRDLRTGPFGRDFGTDVTRRHFRVRTRPLGRGFRRSPPCVRSDFRGNFDDRPTRPPFGRRFGPIRPQLGSHFDDRPPTRRVGPYLRTKLDDRPRPTADLRRPPYPATGRGLPALLGGADFLCSLCDFPGDFFPGAGGFLDALGGFPAASLHASLLRFFRFFHGSPLPVQRHTPSFSCYHHQKPATTFPGSDRLSVFARSRII